MSFEDPFADDLRDFAATATALRRGTAGPTGGGSTAGGHPPASAPVAAPTMGGRGAILDVDVGGAGGGRRRRTGEASHTAASPSPPPPRAAEEPGASALLTGAPSMTGAVAGRRHAAPSPGAEGGPAWFAGVGSRRPADAAPPPAAAKDLRVFESDDPLAFLEQAVRPGEGVAGAPPAAAPGGGPVVLAGETAARQGELARQQGEMRDLRAQLRALEEETTRLEERLSLQEIREDGELLRLSTSLVEKQMELDQQTTQLVAAKAKVEQAAQERLAEARRRYAAELAEQAGEMQRLDGDRFERQVRQLQVSMAEVDASLVQLRQQKRLLLDTDPFSQQSLLLRLSTPSQDGRPPRQGRGSAAGAAAHLEGVGGGHGGRGEGAAGISARKEAPAAASSRDTSGDAYDDETFEDDAAGPADDALEQALQRGVGLVRRYCDRYLSGIRTHVVDYIHAETRQVAHETSGQRMGWWVSDAADRKEQLGEYTTGMLLRCQDLFARRAAQKQQSLARMHEELRQVSAQLRADAAARLERLTCEVTGRLRATSDGFERIAREHAAYVDQKVAQTIAGDVSMAEAQRTEVVRRHETECRIDRQLRAAAAEGVAKELRALRQRGEASGQAAFAQIREGAAASTTQLCAPLQARITDLLVQVESLVEDERRVQQQRARLQWSDPQHMASEERRESLAAMRAEVGERLEKLFTNRARLREACKRLCSSLQDHAAALEEKRHAQQSQQSAIDFARCAWERDHRRNLKMAFTLEVPALLPAHEGLREGEGGGGAPTTVTDVGVETYAAPGDVTATALLELIRDSLAARSDALRAQRARRGERLRAHTAELHTLSQEFAQVRELWARLMRGTEALDEAKDRLTQQGLGTHRASVECEVSMAEVVRQQGELAQRRTALAERQRVCEAERAAALATYEAARAELQKLTDAQLQCAAEEQQRWLVTQRRAHALLLHKQQQQQRRQQRQEQQADLKQRPRPRAFLEDCTNAGLGAAVRSPPPADATPPRPPLSHTAAEDKRGAGQHSGGHRYLPPRSPCSTPPERTRGSGSGSPPSSAAPSAPPASSPPRPLPHPSPHGHSPPPYSTVAADSGSATCTAAPGSSHGHPGPSSRARRDGVRGCGEDSTGLGGVGGAGGRGRAGSPADSSAVSASSLYHSGTFVDLVTMLNSTSMSAIDTP